VPDARLSSDYTSSAGGKKEKGTRRKEKEEDLAQDEEMAEYATASGGS
jgi:hypothetical protein